MSMHGVDEHASQHLNGEVLEGSLVNYAGRHVSKMGWSLGAILDQPNPDISDAPHFRPQVARLFGPWAKEVETQLVQEDTRDYHASAKLAR